MGDVDLKKKDDGVASKRNYRSNKDESSESEEEDKRGDRDRLLEIDVVLRIEDQDPVEEEEDPGQETTTEGEAEAVTGEAEAETEGAEAETEEEIAAGKEWREKESVKEET